MWSTFAVMGIATTALTPVEQTAFLTEYAKALDSRWPRPILGDTLADEVVGGDFVKSYGGRVHLAPLREGVSSSGILRKLDAA